MGRRWDHTREELHRLALDAARDITEREGLRGLGARRVAREIGYATGTLYNLFEDFDDLITHMNGETLDALYDVCAAVPMDQGPENNLRALAQRYLEFTRSHPNLWNAVFEHNVPGTGVSPDWYVEKVLKLQELPERAIADLFPNGSIEEIRANALVLWTSLYGMASVENSDRLPEGFAADELVNLLIPTYLAGLERISPSKAKSRS